MRSVCARVWWLVLVMALHNTARVQAQIRLVQASQACIDSHHVLTQECNESHIEYDDCVCIMQQLKCYNAHDCDYTIFKASPDSQCDSGIDNVIFTQVCSEFGFAQTHTEQWSEDAMIVLLAIILIAVFVLSGMLCLPGTIQNNVYVVCAITGVAAINLMLILYAYETIRRIDELWFAIVVGLVCGSVQLSIACCVVPFLSSLHTIVTNMNRHSQTEPEFSIPTAAFISNNHGTPLHHIPPSASFAPPPSDLFPTHHQGYCLNQKAR